jgi:ankyrin repeat protein
MINYFKYLIYIIVFIGFSSVRAGSYDDFFVAINRDDAATVKLLLSQGFDPNTVGPNGFTGLFMAIKGPSPKAVEALLADSRLNVEVRTAQDESPLMLAALAGMTEVCAQLITRNADVNKPGWAPLHYAATSGNLDTLRLLLDNYAYIDAESPNQTTPLMMAAKYGNPQAVQLLLEAGADSSLKNALGLTAFDFAHQADRLDSANLISAAIRANRPKGKW